MAATRLLKTLILAGLLSLPILSLPTDARAETKRCHCRLHDSNIPPPELEKDYAPNLQHYETCTKDKWFYVGDYDSQGSCDEFCKDDSNYGRDPVTKTGLWTNDPICAFTWTYQTDGFYGGSCAVIEPANCEYACFCRFPTRKQSNVPTTCIGLTTYVGQVKGGNCDCAHKLGGIDEVGIEYLPSATTYYGMCDFQASDYCTAPKNPKSWTCKELQNCWCLFPKDYTNELCRDRWTWKGVILKGEEKAKSYCEARCKNLGLIGAYLTDGYNLCDFRDDDYSNESFKGCVKPENEFSDDCKKLQGEQAGRIAAGAQEDLLKDITKRRGTATSLSLPLGTSSPQRIIGRILTSIFGIVGGLALLAFVYGGVAWMTAAGNPDRITKAKSTLIWASIGLVGIFSAFALLNFILSAFAQ